MPKGDSKVCFTLGVTVDVLAQLEEFRRSRNMSRSTAVCALVKRGYSSFQQE